jgi:hydrogenase maturation protein HypF
VANTNIERRRILVQGIVQGVGFRPFVYGQALQHGLCGFVLNDSAGVTIEVEGEVGALAAFERALREQPPPLSRVDKVVAEPRSPRGDPAFVIAQSQAGDKRRTLIAHDSATCGDCLRELLDPADRRYGYPFINCTNCGPRFTIVQDVPYDRDKTTMRVFPMCPDCRAEYENPLDRRFHAQPNACAACGPQMHFEWWSQEDEGRTTNDERQDSSFVFRLSSPVDPIAVAAHALAAGAILAIKGLGGYHLACDALNAEVVARLRRRKHREAKPFALMAPDLATARMVCQVSAAEAEVLESRRRPIVLLRRDPGARVTVAPGVAPAYATLGLMLPYTPLHHLLLRAFAAAAGPDRPALLVLTSGNMSDEPIAYRDDDARERLASIAEGMLTHNRAIHMRCDDSVVHVVRGGEVRMDRTDTIYGVRTVPLRRSRGYAPEPIPLAFESPVPLLAVGGHLKNTFCLLKGRQAFVSHHIGDLENLETLTSFREGIEHFERLFDIAPLAVAYDLHPVYLATKEAFALAEAWGQGSGVWGQETGDGESQAAQTPDPRSPADRRAASPRAHRQRAGRAWACRAGDRRGGRWHRLWHRRRDLGLRDLARRSARFRAAGAPGVCAAAGRRTRGAPALAHGRSLLAARLWRRISRPGHPFRARRVGRALAATGADDRARCQ